MNHETLIDALPYFDKGYDEPGVREAAHAMVEEETKRYKPTKNYLQNLPIPDASVFETAIMKNEFERLEARQPMELLSMKRYDLPVPPSGSKNDVGAWEECVKNSQAQLMHQEVRMENLQLMMEHGCNAWKSYNEVLDKVRELAQKDYQAIKQKIQEINWQRKNLHTQAGEKLHDLEGKWVNLIGKNYEIEEAIANLEREIAMKEASRSQN